MPLGVDRELRYQLAGLEYTASDIGIGNLYGFTKKIFKVTFKCVSGLYPVSIQTGKTCLQKECMLLHYS